MWPMNNKIEDLREELELKFKQIEEDKEYFEHSRDLKNKANSRDFETLFKSVRELREEIKKLKQMINERCRVSKNMRKRQQ